MRIAALVQKLQQFFWMCPGVTCISFLYYLSYKNYPGEGSHKTQAQTCSFTRLEESSLVSGGFLTAQFLQKT